MNSLQVSFKVIDNKCRTAILQNTSIGSIAIIDQHKILFPVVPNTTGFARETNSPFTS